MDYGSFQFQPPKQPPHPSPPIPDDLIDLPPFHFSRSDFTDQLQQMLDDPPHLTTAQQIHHTEFSYLAT
jgi:hypothetical protein